MSDLQAVTNRLLQNPKDFANLLITFYGAKAAKQFELFFTQHLLIAADLVNAAKNNEVEKLNVSRKKWYQNADEIACFLSEINPYWDKNKWQTMLYRNLEMTEEKAVLRLQGNYDADIKNFANIENEALQMADYMFCGILKQYL